MKVLKLTEFAMKRMFPLAPHDIRQAFVDNQTPLDEAGITATPQRLAYFFANVGHESGGFAIKNLTENINYSHARVAQVWPNRFSSGSSVVAKFGSEPGWQLRLFDSVYGSRMGNRPGTNDGSKYIGRGGPQITGRDGYREVGRRSGLPLEANPELACKAEHQPAICAAFWSWKGLNRHADAGNFRNVVKLWNGGFNGMTDRQNWLSKCRPIISSLEKVDYMPLRTPRKLAGALKQLAPHLPTPPSSKSLRDAALTAAGGGTMVSVLHFLELPWGYIGGGIALAILGIIGYYIWRNRG
jgi:predicted chitinase